MRSSFRRVVVIGAVVAAGTLAGGNAFGLGPEISRDFVGAPSTGAGGQVSRVNNLAAGATASVWEAGDRYRGLGDVGPGPSPSPYPGVYIYPEYIVRGAIQTVGRSVEDVGRGIGGFVVPPIPSPTPSVQPDPGGRNTRVVNSAIQTVGRTVGDVGRGLGGFVVPPIPTPTPSVIPVPALP